MHFITCFDERYMENARRFNGGEPYAPEGAPETKYLEGASHRTFGYFSSLERALQAVRRNEYDLHECLYTWCVVETLGEGIHPVFDIENIGSNERWFRWSDEGQQWEPVQRPEWFQSVIGGFALG